MLNHREQKQIYPKKPETFHRDSLAERAIKWKGEHLPKRSKSK